MHTVKIVKSVNEICKKELDAMVDDNIFMSYGWLKTVEETYTGNAIPKYILVQDSKELIGAAVCYIFNRTNNTTNIDNVLLGRLKKYASILGISFLPAFICCPIFCFGKHFLVKKEADTKEKEVVMDELLAAIEKEAKDQKLSLSFTNIMDDEPELIRLLNKRGYNKTLISPLNYLDIEWSSFEEYINYVNSISRNIKKHIRRQINKNKKEGVIIKQLGAIDGYEARLYDLVNNNYLKHSHTRFPFKREFFRKLKENLGEDAVIYVSFKKDRPTGVKVLLKRNKVGYMPLIGIDHEMAGNDFTYFNMAFYRPIMDAISDEIKKLYGGLGMYEMKARRGFKTNNLYLYYNSYNKATNIAVKLWFTFLSKLYEKKVSQWVKKKEEII